MRDQISQGLGQFVQIEPLKTGRGLIPEGRAFFVVRAGEGLGATDCTPEIDTSEIIVGFSVACSHGRSVEFPTFVQVSVSVCRRGERGSGWYRHRHAIIIVVRVILVIVIVIVIVSVIVFVYVFLVKQAIIVLVMRSNSNSKNS